MPQPTTLKNETKARLENDIDTAKANGRAVIDSARDVVRERMYEAGQTARELWDNASERADAARLRAEGTVRQHPLSTVAIAFGAGLIISKIFSGRRY